MRETTPSTRSWTTPWTRHTPHNGGTVACIQVPLGQSNFFSNGRYQLRVTSQGESKLFPIHVVNETVPSMTLTEASVESGKNVHFQVQDMTYGITMPIYRVDLTDPAGKTTTLTKLDDWYLIGDTFVLYNDKTNHIPTKGTYQLTVYADGFQSFSKKIRGNERNGPGLRQPAQGACHRRPVRLHQQRRRHLRFRV